MRAVGGGRQWSAGAQVAQRQGTNELLARPACNAAPRSINMTNKLIRTICAPSGARAGLGLAELARTQASGRD